MRKLRETGKKKGTEWKKNKRIKNERDYIANRMRKLRKRE